MLSEGIYNPIPHREVLHYKGNCVDKSLMKLLNIQ